jgi:hypothetical protein
MRLALILILAALFARRHSLTSRMALGRPPVRERSFSASAVRACLRVMLLKLPK